MRPQRTERSHALLLALPLFIIYFIYHLSSDSPRLSGSSSLQLSKLDALGELLYPSLSLIMASV